MKILMRQEAFSSLLVSEELSKRKAMKENSAK